MMMRKATPEQAVAKTSVWWDIDYCPVRSGRDAHLMGPSIKRALIRLGYSGPLTITATGTLDDAPDDILRAVSSTGIALNIFAKSSPIVSALCSWALGNPPPANLMVISDDESYTSKLGMISSVGFNALGAYPAVCLLRNVPADAMDSEMTKRHALEEKSCEPGEFALVCKVCKLNFSGQGFEAFTTHRWSKEHALRILSLAGYGRLFKALTECHEKDEEMEDEAGVDAAGTELKKRKT